MMARTTCLEDEEPFIQNSRSRLGHSVQGLIHKRCSIAGCHCVVGLYSRIAGIFQLRVEVSANLQNAITWTRFSECERRLACYVHNRRDEDHQSDQSREGISRPKKIQIIHYALSTSSRKQNYDRSVCNHRTKT
jgi:hypothetical protein